MPNDNTVFLRSLTRMPAIHRSFRADPVGTLKAVGSRLGVDPSKIDAGTLELVASLSDEEIRLIEKLTKRVDDIADLASGHDGAVVF